MRRFKKFIKHIEKRLDIEFSDAVFFPRRGMNPAKARAKMPEKVQMEPVFEIRQGKNKEMFISSFYILNCKIAGHYGITADDPCAVHYGNCGDFEEILPHIRDALQWWKTLESNDFEIPEERKYDAVTDLLSRLDPALFVREWYRVYSHPGNWQQMLGFCGSDRYEASAEVSFYNGSWHIFFELLSKSPEVPRADEFSFESVYSRKNADEIAGRINRILQMLNS